MDGQLVPVVAAAVAVGGALLLIAAGLGHLLHRRALPAALRAQRLLPRRLLGPTAAATVGVELAAGAAVLAAVLLAPAAALAPLVAQALLYGAFTAYLSVVRLLRPAAPCGCFGTTEPVTWFAVARAGLLAAGTTGAVLAAAHVAATPVIPRLLAVTIGVVVAMTAWLLHAVLAIAPRRS